MASAQCTRIQARLERHKRALDLDQNGLGQELLDIQADAMQEGINMGLDITGVPFAELSALYEAWKARHFGGRPIGILHHQMITRQNLVGDRVYTPEMAKATFGNIGDRSRAEAKWFQDPDPGSKPTQPSRRFWGFTEWGIQAANRFLERHFSMQV